MVFLRTEITYISCRIACEKRQLDLAEKKLLHNNYIFGLVGKKYDQKSRQHSSFNTKLGQGTAKRKKQICNSKVFQYYVSYFVLNFKLKLG